MSNIPTLGQTGKEIWQAWRALQGTKVMPRTVIEGVDGEGRTYAWRGDELFRTFVQPVHAAVNRGGAHIGNIATMQSATAKDLDNVHTALDKGQLQIVEKRITGALGYWKPEDAGKVLRVLHQATGVPLSEENL